MHLPCKICSIAIILDRENFSDVLKYMRGDMQVHVLVRVVRECKRTKILLHVEKKKIRSNRVNYKKSYS